MTFDLPRFNQRFVSRLQEGTDEQRFVSMVGDITFQTRANLRTLHDIQSQLKEPLYQMDVNPNIRTVELGLYLEAYPSLFESTLVSKGLQEYVVSLNGLKDATNRLRGRNIAWSGMRQSDGSTIERFDEYIGSSMIGFFPNSLEAPALSIELAQEVGMGGRLVDIEAMWDIEIFPR